MTGKIKDFFMQKESKKNIVIFAVGILLMLILLISEFIPQEKNENNISIEPVGVDEIEAEMECKLEDIIKKLEGIENVKVNIALDGTNEYIYAKDTDENENEKEKSVNSEYIFSQNSDDEPCGLIVSVKAPRVKGVAVVCSGGDNAIVKNEIIRLVSSLYSIGTNCIYVGNYKV